MNRLLTSLIPWIALAILFSISAWASAHDGGSSADKKAKRTPDAVERSRIERKQKKICFSTLEVDVAGAHLRNDHIVVLIGPVPGTESYLVFAEHPGGEAVESLKWDTAPVHAIKTPIKDQNENPIYFISAVPVREPFGEHPDWNDHPMNLVVTRVDEKSGCPVEIEIYSYGHEGVLGFHGGIAHADN